MKITSTDEWSATAVRDLCNQQGWFTGDPKLREMMFEYIEMHRFNPDPEHIAAVALDIQAHTDSNRDMTDYMYSLRRDTIRTFYRIEGE